MATDYAGHDATRLPQADDLRMMRATEQQHANGALSFDEFYQMVAICNRYHNTTMAEYNAFAAKADVDSLLAKRPASYTLEQIRAVVQDEGFARISWQGVGAQKSFANAVCNRLTAPKPKTAEERVTVVAGTGGYFDAKVVSALVAALKEREAHNG